MAATPKADNNRIGRTQTDPCVNVDGRLGEMRYRPVTTNDLLAGAHFPETPG
jgi:hypothetical protein